MADTALVLIDPGAIQPDPENVRQDGTDDLEELVQLRLQTLDRERVRRARLGRGAVDAAGLRSPVLRQVCTSIGSKIVAPTWPGRTTM